MTPAEIIANALMHADLDDSCEYVADQVLHALDAAGLTVVPKVPTPAMVRAAKDRPTKEPRDLYEGIWRAMLAATEGSLK